MKQPERYPEPKTATKKQAAQVRRMAGVRSVEEAEAAANAAVKRRPNGPQASGHPDAPSAASATLT